LTDQSPESLRLWLLPEIAVGSADWPGPDVIWTDEAASSFVDETWMSEARGLVFGLSVFVTGALAVAIGLASGEPTRYSRRDSTHKPSPLPCISWFSPTVSSAEGFSRRMDVAIDQAFDQDPPSSPMMSAAPGIWTVSTSAELVSKMSPHSTQIASSTFIFLSLVVPPQ
jgi:hypothetical protein